MQQMNLVNLGGYMVRAKFACAINCMDGRVQDAVRDYMKKNCGVDYVDMVTEAGPNKILGDNTNRPVIGHIKHRVSVSVRHGSKVVAIVGHPDCGGNPGTKDEQIEDLRKAYRTVESFGFLLEIILLWVEDNWKTVETIPLEAMELATS